ncbi:MAG TPA: Na-translocating system protein MpsC family protein [Solirubrobacteraceae bacterium]|nr:Na-translocating system protein MpsC family protein [Solirubrobacteraceae bacterium]
MAADQGAYDDRRRHDRRDPARHLTKAERTLADRGQATEVLAMRRAFQDTMRDDLVRAIESLTGRTVEAFLSDNLHEPDVAVEIFLMNPHDRDGRRERAMGDGQTLPHA